MAPTLKVLIDGDTRGLRSALGESGQNVLEFSDQIASMIPVPQVAAAAKIVGVAAAITTDLYVAGKDAAVAEQMFADAMIASGGATGDWVKASDDAIIAAQELAFTDDETRDAILSLTRATGDSDEALDLLAVAQDVARLTGKDLATAADAVAKAEAGQDTSLRRMLPGLKKTANAQDTITAATELSAGAADTYAESATAMGEKGSIAFGELKESIGQELVPAMDDLLEAVMPLLLEFIELAKVVIPPVIQGFKLIIGVVKVVIDWLVKIIDAIKKVMTWLTNLWNKTKEIAANITGALQGVIDKFTALWDKAKSITDKIAAIDLNPFNRIVNAGNEVGVSAYGATPQYASGIGGGVTINIHGDPAVIEARVMRALREYGRRNGPGSAFSPSRQ